MGQLNVMVAAELNESATAKANSYCVLRDAYCVSCRYRGVVFSGV